MMAKKNYDALMANDVVLVSDVHSDFVISDELVSLLIKISPEFYIIETSEETLESARQNYNLSFGLVNEWGQPLHDIEYAFKAGINLVPFDIYSSAMFNPVFYHSGLKGINQSDWVRGMMDLEDKGGEEKTLQTFNMLLDLFLPMRDSSLLETILQCNKVRTKKQPLLVHSGKDHIEVIGDVLPEYGLAVAVYDVSSHTSIEKPMQLSPQII